MVVLYVLLYAVIPGTATSKDGRRFSLGFHLNCLTFNYLYPHLGPFFSECVTHFSVFTLRLKMCMSKVRIFSVKFYGNDSIYNSILSN